MCGEREEGCIIWLLSPLQTGMFGDQTLFADQTFSRSDTLNVLTKFERQQTFDQTF